MSTTTTRGRNNNSSRNNNNGRRYKWVKPGLDPINKTTAILAREVANEISKNLRDNTTELALGILLENPVENPSNLLFELIKVYTFQESALQYFPNAVRLSPSRSHVLVNVVRSNHDRSRNYFARRAADLAKIPVDIVQTATNIAVAYNTGVVKEGEVWYPPEFVSVAEQQVPLLQLLVVIFTNERLFPSYIEGQRPSFSLISFTSVPGTELFANIYESFLLHSTEENVCD